MLNIEQWDLHSPLPAHLESLSTRAVLLGQWCTALLIRVSELLIYHYFDSDATFYWCCLLSCFLHKFLLVHCNWGYCPWICKTRDWVMVMAGYVFQKQKIKHQLLIGLPFRWVSSSVCGTGSRRLPACRSHRDPTWPGCSPTCLPPRLSHSLYWRLVVL